MLSPELMRTMDTYHMIAPTYARQSRSRGGLTELYQRFLSLLDEEQRSQFPILDVGCGPGYDLLHFQQHGWRTIGLDLSLAMIVAGISHRPSLANSDFVQADMTLLPLCTGSAAGVWACASLLHLPDHLVPQAIAEMYRVLVPDGVMCVVVKVGQGEEWTENSRGHALPRYYRYYMPETLDPLLADAGFLPLAGWINQDQRTGQKWLVRYIQK